MLRILIFLKLVLVEVLKKRIYRHPPFGILPGSLTSIGFFIPPPVICIEILNGSLIFSGRVYFCLINIISYKNFNFFFSIPNKQTTILVPSEQSKKFTLKREHQGLHQNTVQVTQLKKVSFTITLTDGKARITTEMHRK